MKCTRCNAEMERPSSGMGGTGMRDENFCESCTVKHIENSVVVLKNWHDMERMERALRQIVHRCARLERSPALEERERVLAWFDANMRGPVSSTIRQSIARGEHLPGGALPPADPKAGLACGAAGIPPSMRCPSCKASHVLGLDS